jgi:hypothetical protein
MDKDMAKKAKKEMIKMLKKSMRDDAYGEMGEGLKKVTVASDSMEGLEEGLSKAEQILKKRFEDMGMDPEEMEDREEESMEEEEMLEEEMPEEEIDKIRKKKEKKPDEHADGGLEEMDYDEEQGEVPGEQDTGPDEYTDGGYESEGRYLDKKYKKAKKK